MNTNENIRNDTSEDVIELGLASVETKGTGATVNEPFGHSGEVGISE
ncbi:benenodin family lasso peptide [Rhodanobacter koreensis]